MLLIKAFIMRCACAMLCSGLGCCTQPATTPGFWNCATARSQSACVENCPIFCTELASITAMVHMLFSKLVHELSHAGV
jgi:hypothetical protein